MRRYDIKGVMHELRYRRTRQHRTRPQLPSLSSTPSISMVCVSNRPAQAQHIADSYHAQDWPSKELVIVANAVDFPTDCFVEQSGVTFLERSPDVTLGRCLNAGFAQATGEIIARIDDDDWYAPTYLSSLAASFDRSGAAVIGKAEYFAYIESRDVVVRRFPGMANRYVGRLAGGTISVRSEAVRGIRFPDQSLGEDIHYLRACERAGMGIWAGDPHGFLQVRSAQGDHTWKINDRVFADGAPVVAKGRPDAAWQRLP